jgi:hypothetical protein
VKKKRRKEKEADCIAKSNRFIITTGAENDCPHVYQTVPFRPFVTVGWKQGTALEIEEGRIMGSGLL